MATVAAWTGSEKAADTALDTATPVAPDAGVRVVTVGGVVSGVVTAGVKTTSTQ
jgi:hypothetical protein